jgi:thiamine-monophosphate kinase
MPTESEIIAWLKKRVSVNDDVLLGIGDDAAVIKVPGGRDVIACCDLMVEGVHVRTEWTPARLLGRKALAVNLSDVAAMGGVPKFAMMSIALPKWCSADFVDELLLKECSSCRMSAVFQSLAATLRASRLAVHRRKCDRRM